MNSSTLELVNKAFALLTLPSNNKIIFRINQAFLDRDPLRTEALLQSHQSKAFGIIVDDSNKRYIALTGKPCGCQGRKDTLNRVFPYNNE